MKNEITYQDEVINGTELTFRWCGSDKIEISIYSEHNNRFNSFIITADNTELLCDELLCLVKRIQNQKGGMK